MSLVLQVVFGHKVLDKLIFWHDGNSWKVKGSPIYFVENINVWTKCHAIYPVIVRHFNQNKTNLKSNKNQLNVDARGKVITKVTVHPLGTMNTCIEFLAFNSMVVKIFDSEPVSGTTHCCTTLMAEKG